MDRKRASAARAAVMIVLLAGCVQLPSVRRDASAQTPDAPDAAAKTIATDPQVVTKLLDILQHSDRIKRPDPRDFEDQPLGEMLKVGSPVGYALRNRYFNPGVPIAEALSRGEDPLFRERLVEMARWARSSEVRGMALLGLASLRAEEDFVIFQEAIAHLDPAVRFGAMEALFEWARPPRGTPEFRKKAMPMFKVASDKDNEPLLRIYAAQAGVRLGDREGLKMLRDSLESPSWLSRAMAARYLGDLGEAKDYDTFVTRLGREQGNDFVLAEYCIAALKLFPKKEASPR